MRLTLRTLLAYLDDTLEADQAKVIGQKIAESEQARDIIKLIEQVTRRRRITTPPDSGPGGKLDPNTLGEYLDNEIPPEQAAEVEEICLASDTHLAEIAACHQILTLIVGESALAPPSAYQRMYGLVKGPESIPFRKPAPVMVRTNHEIAEGRDVDDTLRLGLAPVTGKHRGSPWLLLMGGLAAACLLAVAVWQIVKEPSDRVVETAYVPFKKQVVPNGPAKAAPTPVAEPKRPIEAKKKVEVIKAAEKKDENQDLPEVKLPPIQADLPLAPPSAVVQVAGKLVVDAKEPALLLRWHADGNEWQSVTGKLPEVPTGRPLVNLPASKSVIRLAKGLNLTLVGGMPELYFPPPSIYDCAVELHAHDQLDLDLTLRRGRIRVAAPERPARIRVRFDNPTQPNHKEYLDIALQIAGSEVLIERWFTWPRNEKFHKNPMSPDRKGPVAEMTLFVLAGSAMVKHHDVSHAMASAPGNVLLYWNSLKGLDPPVSFPALPEGLTAYSPLPPKTDPRIRTDLLRAREELQSKVWTNALDVALADGCKSANPALRRLACASLGAVDDVAGLLEQLEQERLPDLRATAVEMLRQWMVSGRDHEYKVYELLNRKYKAADADNIMALLHDLSDQDMMSPKTYERLISELDDPQLIVRELAWWHLTAQVPAGRKIRFNASADLESRRQAQRAWRALIPMNELPPMPKKN